MNIDIPGLIGHPERLDKETLYGLRELVARYPYFQAARLLFLQNLFLLHDASFGEELRRAALHLPDRRVLFKMVEGSNYDIQPSKLLHRQQEPPPPTGDRTQTLIDGFLRDNAQPEEAPRRKLTLADATTDYAAYLLQMEDAETETPAQDNRARRSSTLINDFIEKSPDRIVLQEDPQFTPEIPDNEQEEAIEEGFFTETLAKIYIKQGRYEKAIEIIRKLSLNYPKKNSYFADQIRFLQKLIINNKNKK